MMMHEAQRPGVTKQAPAPPRYTAGAQPKYGIMPTGGRGAVNGGGAR